ncbi:MAG: hypothetical protein HW419_4067, partial [Deltaproteobacteria bacterium]|nr:hypothetical protein [Deltaproteobacteria bacterium]
AHPTKTFVSFVIFVVKNPFLLCVLCARYSEFRVGRSRARPFVVNLLLRFSPGFDALGLRGKTDLRYEDFQWVKPASTCNT